MPGCACWYTLSVIVALACPRRSETTFHGHAVREKQGGMGVAEVVQADRRQFLLSQRLPSLDDLADEAPREPLQVL